ncbi:hypothetical protein V9L05_19225 [Bernardetia sp. Wsw4-3y2]|uniref:hypothetical protein n=1 Tax=Bernardetia sp. Wsw4-3y2 TaxID=3127471 RepID=UPI0030D27BF3
MLKLKIDKIDVNNDYVEIVGDIIQSDLDTCFKTYSYLCSIDDFVKDSNSWIGNSYIHLSAYRGFISKKGITNISLKSFIEDWLDNFSSVKAGSLFEYQMKCRFFFQFDSDYNFGIEETVIDKNAKLISLNKIEFMAAEGCLSDKKQLRFEPFTETFCQRYRTTNEFEIILKLNFCFDDGSSLVGYTTIITAQKFKRRINRLFLERGQDIILSFSHIPVDKFSYEDIISIFTPKVWKREDRFFRYDVKGKNIAEMVIKLLPYLDIDNPNEYLSDLIVENNEVYTLDIDQAKQEIQKFITNQIL